MPEWFGTAEAYSPRPDRASFLGRSLASFLGIIARIRSHGADRAFSPVHPALGLAACLLLVLLVSLSRNLYFLGIVGTLELVLLSAQSGREIASILKTGLVAALFTAAILVPSFFLGNHGGSVAVVAKVLLSVVAAALLMALLGWSGFTSGLSALGVPDTFVLVLDLAIKYIFLLSGLAVEMLQAVKLRSVGRNSKKTEALGAIAGTVFLRSMESARELHEAMECRGFSGDYRARRRKPRLGLGDFATLGCLALVGAVFFYLQGA